MFSVSYLSQGLILYKGTDSEEPTKPDQKIIVQTTLSIFCLHPNAMQKCKKKTNKVKIEQIIVCTGLANIRRKNPLLCGSFGIAFLFLSIRLWSAAQICFLLNSKKNWIWIWIFAPSLFMCKWMHSAEFAAELIFRVNDSTILQNWRSYQLHATAAITSPISIATTTQIE